MYQQALSFLNEYVEISTYLSQYKLYGKIISVTPIEIALLRDQREKYSHDDYTLYIPLNSVISIRKL